MQRRGVERTASKKWRGSARRLLAALLMNISVFAYGCTAAWPGALNSKGGVLAGGASLAALPSLSALPATPALALLADTRGRRPTAVIVALCFICCWWLTWTGGPRAAWGARVIAGVGSAGAFVVTPLYCVEVAPYAKGLSAVPALACSFGILFVYSLNGIVSSRSFALWMMPAPLILLLSLFWLPETPVYLLRIGKIQEAARVMCWFDGSDFREDITDAVEQQEVQLRRGTHSGDVTTPMLEVNDYPDSGSEDDELSVCHELFCLEKKGRLMLYCAWLALTTAGSGAPVISAAGTQLLTAARMLGEQTFDKSPPKLNTLEDMTSVICCLALVLGATLAVATIDRIGRRMLLLWSCSGMACCLALLGVYCDPRVRHALTSMLPQRRIINQNSNEMETVIKLWQNTSTSTELNSAKLWVEPDNTSSREEEVIWNPGVMKHSPVWPPLVLMSATLFLFNIGLGSVPYVLVFDFFSTNVRSFAWASISLCWWLSSFIVMRYFGTIITAFGLHWIYYICSVIVLSAIPVILNLPSNIKSRQP